MNLSSKLRKSFFFCLLILSTLIEAQTISNTLDVIGLTPSQPANVAFSVRKLSSSYSGPLFRLRVGSNYYDVYPDASANEISLNSLISASTLSTSTAQPISTNTLGSLAAIDAYVAIWYDQSGNANNLVQLDDNMQPKIIESSAIKKENGRPIIYWHASPISLRLNNTLNTNGQIIVVNKFSTNGFLLGDINNYYWHCQGVVPPSYLFDDSYTSASIRNGIVFQNGAFKTSVNLTSYNTDLGINSVSPVIPSQETTWDNIGVDRVFNHTDVGAGWSEIFSFPNELDQTLRAGVESNQSSYYSISLSPLSAPPGERKIVYTLNPWDNSYSRISKYILDTRTNTLTKDISYISSNADNNISYFGIEMNPANQKIYTLSGNFQSQNRFLFEFDLSSGVAAQTTEIGRVVSGSGNGNAQGFTFDNNGNLFAYFQNGSISKIDYSNPTPGSNLPVIADLNITPLPTLNGARGISFDYDNNKLLISGQDGIGYSLYSVDPVTGQAIQLLAGTPYRMQAIHYIGNSTILTSATAGTDAIFLRDWTSGSHSNLISCLSCENTSPNIKDFVATNITSGLTPLISITPPIANTLTSTCDILAPSAATTFGVTGSNLSSTVTVSAPTGFEISASQNTGYTSSLSLTPDESGSVSSTLYVRLSAGYGGGISGTITASSAGATTQTTTVSSTIVAPPSFSTSGPFSICNEATYLVALATPNSYNGWSTSDPNVFSVNSAGYITATASSAATATITYTDACGQSVSQTVNVVTSDISAQITNNQIAYKFNGNPQGPTLSGSTINYVGYDGYSYYGQTQPTQVGYYKANIQSGNEAGCTNRFYIFKCTTCNN